MAVVALAGRSRRRRRQAPADSGAADGGQGREAEPPNKSEQAIVALVNDDPITGYEIQQRARFLSISANVSDRARDAFKRLIQAESTNQQVRAILEQVIRNNPASRGTRLAPFSRSARNSSQ